MFITFNEILDMVIIVFVLGYIFSDYLVPQHYANGMFDWQSIKFAALIISPAVILHELFHKFVALSFGLPAFFKVFWLGLVIALILKMVRSPLLILAPAYVVYPAMANSTQNMLIAFAGPFANLLLFIVAHFWLKFGNYSRKSGLILALTKKINLFLFIFNMIPLAPLDGYYVLRGLINLF